MQKRARAVETTKMRRALKVRRIADIRECHSIIFAYIKLMGIWFGIVGLDYCIGIRSELFWPAFTFVRYLYDHSHNRAHLVHFAHGQASVAFLVCVTLTSDLVCYLFIPGTLLIFFATLYMWIETVWYLNGGLIRTVAVLSENEKTTAYPIMGLWAFFFFFEVMCRMRCAHQVLFELTLDAEQDCAFLRGVGGPISRHINPVMASHCIGYPLVMITFHLSTYYKEWRLRRRQEEVSKKNEIIVRLLTEALPAVYDGPKNYRTRSECAAEDDSIEDDFYTIERDEIPALPPAPPTKQLLPPPSSSPLLTNGASTTRKQSIRGSAKRAGGLANGRSIGGGGGGPPSSNGTTPSSRLREDDEDDDGGEWGTSDGVSAYDDSTSGPLFIRVIVGAVSRLFVSVYSLVETLFWFLVGGKHLGRRVDQRNGERKRSIAQPSPRVPSRDLPSSSSSSAASPANGNSHGQATAATARSRLGTKERQENGWHAREETPQLQQQQQLGVGRAANGTATAPPAAANGRMRSKERDASRDSTQTQQSEDSLVLTGGRKLCGDECAKQSADNQRMRGELRTLRAAEESARLQASNCANGEKMAQAEAGQLKTRSEQLTAKIAALERSVEAEKSAAMAAARKLAEAQHRKEDVERELVIERKRAREAERARENGLATKDQSLNEAQLALREKDAAWEREAERLRKDLSNRDDTIAELTAELEGVKRTARTAAEVEELRAELALVRDKNASLETSLAAENKLKQELFRALRNSNANQHSFHMAAAQLPSKMPPSSTTLTPPPSLPPPPGIPLPIARASPPAYTPPDSDYIGLRAATEIDFIGAPGAPARPAYSFASPLSSLGISSGEHTLFDPPNGGTPFALACSLASGGGSSHDNGGELFYAQNMGKFGAPSPANSRAAN